jgi:hypothetical protein
MIVSPMKIPRRGYSKRVGGHVTKVIGALNHLEATNGLPYDCCLPWFECSDCVCMANGLNRRIPGSLRQNKVFGCRAGIAFLKP